MSRIRVFITPFLENGDFASEIEVTEDVKFNSMGTITQSLDNDEFNIGVFRFTSFSLKLRNEDGRFSDIDVSLSIFRFKRAGSLVRLTWEVSDDFPETGIAVAGNDFLSSQVTIFDGRINDDSAALDIAVQDVTFRVLGLESVFDEVEVPFSSLTGGDTFSSIIFDILNQTEITDLMTVSTLNINVDTNLATDSIADFENQTVKEALDDLLFLSNSVLFIKDTTVFVRSRDAAFTTKITFIGQASPNGIEDIQNITNLRTGLNKTFNFWTWKDDATAKATDSSSIALNGIRKKEIDFDQITGTTKRNTILAALKDEFRNPEQSFDLTTLMNDINLDAFLLDRVSVDYPTVFFAPGPIPSIGVESPAVLPLYGIAIYGEASYPFAEFSLTIDSADSFKVLGRKINTQNQLVTFQLRKV